MYDLGAIVSPNEGGGFRYVVARYVQVGGYTTGEYTHVGEIASGGWDARKKEGALLTDNEVDIRPFEEFFDGGSGNHPRSE